MIKPNIEEFRKNYMDNPPQKITTKDTCSMSEVEPPDVNYFLKENDLLDSENGVKGFYIF